MRVVIVSYNWPPRNAIGTHRPYSWARYWSEAGAQVTVLTARKQAFDVPLDLELPKLPNVEVIEVPYGAASGLVNVILKSDVARRLAKKVKAAFNRRAPRSIDPRMAWWKAAKPVAEELALRADVVVSTFGPAAAHLIANDMKQANARLRWVADYRDLWSQRHTSEGSTAERQEIAQIERDTVGRNADLITAVSQDMVRQLAELTGKAVTCVPNGFDIDEEELRRRLQIIRRQPGHPFRIVYTGTIYEGFQDPTPLLEALAALKAERRLDDGALTVDFYGSRVDVARKLAQDTRFKPFIRIMGHVSRDKALAAQCSADLLLLLESPAPEARGVLTGKLFEYMASGRPILGIGSLPEYEIGRVLAVTGTGQTFGPDAYAEIGNLIAASLKGGGLFSTFDPRAEGIEAFSRKRLAQALFEKLKNE